MKYLLSLAVVLSIGAVAQAHIPVTESTTVMDANVDGAPFVGNYRVSDDCGGKIIDPKRSSGLAIFKLGRAAWENTIAGVQSKHVELQYTYMRKKKNIIGGGGGYKVKTGTVLLNKIRKLTHLQKVDGQVVSQQEEWQADNIEVVGDLADDSKDGSYPVSFENGQIRIKGKDCDQQVVLTPTTDVTP